MSAVDRIAAELRKHKSGRRRTCLCGWQPPLGTRWMDPHARHQAEVIAGLDGLVVAEAEEMSKSPETPRGRSHPTSDHLDPPTQTYSPDLYPPLLSKKADQ